MHHHTELSSVNFDGFQPFTMLFFFGAFWKWAAIFTLLLFHYVAFLHRTATCRPLFKPLVSLLSTYKAIELCFEFLLRF
jgi:hypothetical protein